MGRLNFEDLSVDVKSLIVQHITRPTGLVNLCLVNKQLHEITVRVLYYEVALDIGSKNDAQLASFLNPKNIGIQHVRKLDLYLAQVQGRYNQVIMANLAIRMILEFLPENQLERFSWQSWTPFSGENLMLLYRKQKRMKWLEGIALDKNMLEDLQKIADVDKVFENVTELGLYPDSREVLDYCQLLVEKSPKVEEITLDASFDEHDPALPARELNDSSTGPGLIASTIFSHMQPFAKCKPLALKHVALQKIALRYAADTYCKVIDFRTVKSLRVLECSGTDALFAELSKSTKLPHKLETLELKLEDNTEQDGLGAVDGFLCLVSGIKKLTMDITNAKTLPAAAGIVRHAKTLTQLNVHANGIPDGCDYEIIYDYSSFADICKNCKVLEQLSVGFPRVCLVEEKDSSFVDFEDCLGELPKLVTLNITTWPSPSHTELPRKTYEHLLQGMAQESFEKSAVHAAAKQRSPKLAMIAWGASDTLYNRDDSKNLIIFVKGRQVDALGKESSTAIQMSFCLRRYTDAGRKSDILDFSLSRSTRPPATESAESDDSD